MHTIGVEFSSRTIKLGEKRIKLQVLEGCRGSKGCAYFLSVAVGYSRARTISVCTLLFGSLDYAQQIAQFCHKKLLSRRCWCNIGLRHHQVRSSGPTALASFTFDI